GKLIPRNLSLLNFGDYVLKLFKSLCIIDLFIHFCSVLTVPSTVLFISPSKIRVCNESPTFTSDKSFKDFPLRRVMLYPRFRTFFGSRLSTFLSRFSTSNRLSLNLDAISDINLSLFLKTSNLYWSIREILSFLIMAPKLRNKSFSLFK